MLDLSPDAKPIIRRGDRLAVTVEDTKRPEKPFKANPKDADFDERERFLVRGPKGEQVGLFSFRELDSRFVNDARRDDPDLQPKKAGAKK